MTTLRRDSTGTQFGTWLRTQHQELIGSNQFSAQNLDYIWHNYRDGWFITIEEKRWRKASDKAQLDTHGIVAQMLKAASGIPVQTMRGVRPAEYKGHYVIVFENTTPDDGWVNVNHKRVDKNDILKLLMTGKIEND